ncbi:MAG: hypothetical protein ACYSR6_10895, partial [Planctomycetota bacterium]
MRPVDMGTDWVLFYFVLRVEHMPEVFKERIIKHLKHGDYTPLKLARLAKSLGVSSEDYPQFKLAFEELRRS